MRISCLQENFAKGLSIVGRAVSSRSTLPVLGNVMISSDNGRLKLSTTDLEIVITCWVGAKVDEEGAITIPARTLTDLINTLPADRVDLELDEETQTMHIACARTEANIKGIDAEEFPLIPEPESDNRIRVEIDVLKQMIGHVDFAAATDDTRPVLTGILTTFSKDKMKMAATDGFRLSVSSASIPSNVEEEKSIIVPARALTELSRIMMGDKPVYISLPEGRNQIIFEMEHIVLVSQLIDGAFPDYTPIIPTRTETRTVMSTGSLSKACKTAAIFARESSHTARITVEPEDELNRAHAIVAATSAEMGDNVAQIDALVEGNGVEIAFNVKYLTDVLNVIDTPQVALETTSAMEPGVIRPVGDDDFLHVIMPMHFGK